MTTQIENKKVSVPLTSCGHCAPSKSSAPATLDEKLYFSIATTAVIMLFSMQHMIFGHHIVSPQTTNLILLLLATPIQFWVGYQFHNGFLNTLKIKTADMNTLISIGTNTAYFYSVYMTFFGGGEYTYYDTSAMIITIVLVGSFFEAKARAKASDALSRLLDLAPEQALVIRSGVESRINVSEIKVGDVIIVRPGGRIPTDGVVLEGSSTVDEALITGENMPVDKKIEDRVFGGTLNKTGILKFRVDKPIGENTLASIVNLLEEAQTSKPSIQRLADTVAKYFVPAVLLISVITLVAWSNIDSIPYGISKAIAVLIVACPCALGLATPIAVVVFLGNALKEGIIIKEAKTLETIAKVDTVAFDKTGTLTVGAPAVVDVIAAGEFHPPEVIAFASSAEKHSEHPIAKAILAKCIYTPPDPEDFEAVSGFGVKAKVRSKSILVGNAELMRQYGVDISSVSEKIQELEEQAKTIVYVGAGNKLAGVITTSDTLKKEAPAVIQWLNRNDIDVVMITGDTEKAALATARKAGIQKVFAKLTPEYKVKTVKSIRSGGKIVAMIGDGINDAPSLASANIGIAIDAATDITKEASDVTLVSGNLYKLINVIEISKNAVKTVKQNLWLAFGYNILLIPITAGVFYKYGLTLTPEVSAVAMSLSSLTVIGNSLRLK